MSPSIPLGCTSPCLKRFQRQLQSGSVRRTGKEDGREYDLKPSIVVRRVQLPPGKGQSASRKPALRVTAMVARSVAGAEAAGVSLEISQCRSPRRPDRGGSINVAALTRTRRFDRGPGTQQRHGMDRLVT